MTQLTFYLDLDRTLFQTHRVDELFAAIARIYPEKPHIVNAYAERQKYYVYPFASSGDTVTYYHDVGHWMADEGLVMNDVLMRLIADGQNDGRFEFSGTREFVDELKGLGDVKVLTFGTDDYQRFKAALCPSLVGVEIITTFEPKGDALARIGKTGDWLVDDKLVAVPEGMNFVQVMHGDGDEPTQHPPVCSSLTEVLDHIRQRL